MTSERVREEIDLILDEIAETLDRCHEARIRVDSAGSLFVDRTRAEDD